MENPMQNFLLQMFKGYKIKQAKWTRGTFNTNYF